VPIGGRWRHLLNAGSRRKSHHGEFHLCSLAWGPRGYRATNERSEKLGEVFKSLVGNTQVLKIFAFANNHYSLCPHRHNAASRISIIPLVLWTVLQTKSPRSAPFTIHIFPSRRFLHPHGGSLSRGISKKEGPNAFVAEVGWYRNAGVAFSSGPSRHLTVAAGVWAWRSR
jgi:hypothetical protein